MCHDLFWTFGTPQWIKFKNFLSLWALHARREGRKNKENRQIKYLMWMWKLMSKIKVEQDKRCLVKRGHMIVLNNLVRTDLTEKVTYGQALVNIWGASSLGGAKSWCKSPQMSVCLAHSRNSKEASMNGTEYVRGRVCEAVRDKRGTKLHRACSHCKDFEQNGSYWNSIYLSFYCNHSGCCADQWKLFYFSTLK